MNEGGKTVNPNINRQEKKQYKRMHCKKVIRPPGVKGAQSQNNNRKIGSFCNWIYTTAAIQLVTAIRIETYLQPIPYITLSYNIRVKGKLTNGGQMYITTYGTRVLPLLSGTVFVNAKCASNVHCVDLFTLSQC
jgi:hypothetical protein